MDYAALAAELLQKMHALHKARPQQNIDKSLQGEAFVLRYIACRHSKVLPGDISHEMGVSSASTATALNKLEDRGLITRQIDKNDHRQILVELTNEGNALAEQHLQAVSGVVQKMLSLLGERDAKEYVRIVGKLADIVSRNEAAL